MGIQVDRHPQDVARVDITGMTRNLRTPNTGYSPARTAYAGEHYRRNSGERHWWFYVVVLTAGMFVGYAIARW